MIKAKILPVALWLLVALLQLAHALDKKPGGAIKQRTSGTGSDGVFRSPCGPKEEVAKRAATCLMPLFEIIEGRFEKAPTNQAEVLPLCDKFPVCERCLRGVAKDCLPGGGVHKVAVGAFASSTIRFRRQECKTEQLRERFIAPLKCLKTIGPEVGQVYRNGTGIASGIRDLKQTPEEKVVKLCCLLNELDRELATRINKHCPELKEIILELVHSVTEDAKSTLCLSTKCQGALNGVVGSKARASQLNLIEPVMEILLTISTE